MEQNQTHSAATAAPVRALGAVTFLRCHTPAILDPYPIHHILSSKGEVVGEAMICRILEDIALRLDNLQAAKFTHSFAEIDRPARRIVHVSSRIGLVDVSQSAGHVGVAARQEDEVALSATLARLERAFDVAVSEIWRYRDYT